MYRWTGNAMAGGPAGSARMLTVQRPPAVPVLTFAAEPDGGPPPVLRVGGTEEFARRPAGGPPMLVLRRRADVLRTLTDSKHFGMAGVTDTGELRGCPLTGAEMQSPDGGLLNMDPPALRDYRQRINGLFTRGAAEATRPAVHELATALAARLASQPAADVLTGFAEPFTASAVCLAMGIPSRDWDEVLEYSRIAFAVVPSSAEVAAVAAAWADLYDYYEQMVAAKRVPARWDINLPADPRAGRAAHQPDRARDRHGQQRVRRRAPGARGVPRRTGPAARRRRGLPAWRADLGRGRRTAADPPGHVPGGAAQGRPGGRLAQRPAGTGGHGAAAVADRGRL